MDRERLREAVAYRGSVASCQEVAAVVVPTSREVGDVLKALRGLLYTHRGVRNVIDLQPVERGDGDGCEDGTLLFAWQRQRWCVVGKDQPPGCRPQHQLKALLLDPAVLAASAVPKQETAGARRVVLTSLPFASLEAATEMGIPRGLAERLQSAAALVEDSSRRLHGGCKGEGKAEGASGAPPQLFVGLTTVTVHLTYENYTMSELLSMVLSSDASGAAKLERADSPSAEEGEGCAPAGGMNNAMNTPDELVALSGFEQVGHIAHVNLSKSHRPFRYTIGRVILDCNPTVAVVVNKTDAISSEFREFPMEVIAVRADDELTGVVRDAAKGCASPPRLSALSEDELLIATVRQHGCVFEVPYNRVYWNSRLSHEHTRLVDMMKANDVLFDVMAGVGPFAVPAAKRGVLVFANDLNPAAAEYMVVNRARNKISEAALTVFQWDGRVFLEKVVYDCVMGLTPPAAGRGRKHVVMNLPATAVQFLDVFAPPPRCEHPRGGHSDSGGADLTERVALPDGRGWYRRHRWNCRPASVPEGAIDKTLLIHVYGFAPAVDPLGEAVRQVEQSLGYALAEKNKESVFVVRDVAPQKRMTCVSFTLPDAFWAHQVAVEETGGDDPPAQRARVE